VYDENDGFFDHMVPRPHRSRGPGLSTVDTTNESVCGNSAFSAGPYGLGSGPLLVISPWSKGGWFNFPSYSIHTSLIRFIERAFAPDYPGLRESHITPWRRARLWRSRSAFNFATPMTLRYRCRAPCLHPAHQDRHPDYSPLRRSTRLCQHRKRARDRLVPAV